MSRAKWLTEWLRFLHDAQRFGSRNPGAIADALAGPEPPPEKRGGFLRSVARSGIEDKKDKKV